MTELWKKGSITTRGKLAEQTVGEFWKYVYRFQDIVEEAGIEIWSKEIEPCQVGNFYFVVLNGEELCFIVSPEKVEMDRDSISFSVDKLPEVAELLTECSSSKEFIAEVQKLIIE